MISSLKKVIETSKQLTVLYVEDEPDTREETKNILDDIFFKVIVAINGADGFEKFQENNSIDLIITDINMPKLNGIDMIEKIHSLDAEVPILVLSAYSDVDYFIETIRLGIDGYIFKTINIKQLAKSLDKVTHKLFLQKENDEYKHNLEQKIEEEIQKREYQDKIMIQQSKMAAMGEMIDAVAHQWKQPLNIMHMQVDMLQYNFEDGDIDAEFIDKFIKEYKLQMKHMLSTLDEFRSFFRPNQEISNFSISEVIDNTLLLTKDEFIKNRIMFKKDIDKNIQLNGSENEFKHLILNIINNSKDAFIENNIENRMITFTLYNKLNKIILEISDNAGGIPKYIIDDIFKMNITSKELGKGTGIGLYMSQQIAHKHGGTLKVKNISNGATFIFETTYQKI